VVGPRDCPGQRIHTSECHFLRARGAGFAGFAGAAGIAGAAGAGLAVGLTAAAWQSGGAVPRSL